MVKEIIKHRKIIVAKPPNFISTEEIKEIKITQVEHMLSKGSDFQIYYDGATCTFQYKPSEKEIEAFCIGVDAARDSFLFVLEDFFEDEIINKIEHKLSLLYKDDRGEENESL
ncbi:hypothetical protein MKX73_19135 [Solibacillus sp. FSL W7-1436]|uniref:hypothetical protein n=1 Tax=Solibacillus sp. FSL W7-1436 TaxID=2921705 RepID=UPI0030F7D2DA